MVVFTHKFIIAFCIALLPLAAMCQLKFEASATPNPVSKDGYVTVRLVVENGKDVRKISPPDFSGFTVISGPNQESGMSNVNGAVTQFIGISYILKPQKNGTFNIGSAIAVVDGKRINSNPVKIQVDGRSPGQNPQSTNPLSNLFAMQEPEPAQPRVDLSDYVLHANENVAEKVNKNMMLRATANKLSVYVGEPVTASYKFYTRLKSESQLEKNPSFNGFSVIDLSTPDEANDPRVETVNGKQYNVFTIRKAQLYPLQEGDITLEPATLNNSITFLKDDGNSRANANDLLNGFALSPDAMIKQTVSLSSKPIVIHVKALPQENKPSNFAGAVGSFVISAAVEKSNFTTDETGSLTISIGGAGNLQLVNEPAITWPDGLSGFDPKVTENMDNQQVPVTGTKLFTYVFSVQKAGSYTIPAVQFSFFNPATGFYKTVSTNPIQLQVVQGAGKPAFVAADTTKTEQTSVINKLNQNRWWVILSLVGIVAIGLFVWLRNARTNPAPEPVRNADEEIAIETAAATTIKKQLNPLEQTELCLYKDDCKTFFEILSKELRVFLASKFEMNIADVNAGNMQTALDKRNVDILTSAKLAALLNKVEFQLYSPLQQTDNWQAVYKEAVEVIQEINEAVS